MSQAAAAFLDRIVPKVERLSKGVGEAYWNFSCTGQDVYQEEYARLKEELIKIFADKEAFAELQAVRKVWATGDPVMKRQLDLLYNDFVGSQLDEATIQELVRRESEIEGLFTNFRAQYQGRAVSDNELGEVLRKENNSALRQQAWEASKQIGAQVAHKVLDLVKVRNRAAEGLGFPNHYTMALQLSEIDEDELFQLLERLEQLTREPFFAMKARLDAELADRFGIAVADMAPWHYTDPFFQEAPQTKGVDLDRFYAGNDPVTLAKRFYDGIGLGVDDILARSDLYEREGKNQHAFCIDIDRAGDVRILCNMRQDERWMSTLLHELGHGVYDQYHDKSLPYLLRGYAHISTTEAIAMMMGRLTKNADWLRRIAEVDASQATAAQAAVSAHLALSQLIFIRWGLVMVYFERALYKDPGQDLNRLWWNLVERLQGVRKPYGRENHSDWAAKIHIGTSPVYYQNYILGELMASQLLAAIRKVTNTDTIVDQEEAGRFLRERVFHPGARMPWNDMLEAATGERLNPAYFAKEFVQVG